MFQHEPDYPIAVASPDEDGLQEAITWCAQHMLEDDLLTVWTAQKQQLGHSSILERLVRTHSDVEHVTARGGASMPAAGPALLAWPDLGEIAEFLRFNGNRVRALCVVSWVPEQLRAWVSAVKPQVLGDPTSWSVPGPFLDPVVQAAMRHLTGVINHNNTIGGGYEKDEVVSVLLALHDAGYSLDGETMAGWALAHGWVGKNPTHLEKYVTQINQGRRPRSRRVVRADFIDRLREEAANSQNR